jgi:hypothetical protein
MKVCCGSDGPLSRANHEPDRGALLDAGRASRLVLERLTLHTYARSKPPRIDEAFYELRRSRRLKPIQAESE